MCQKYTKYFLFPIISTIKLEKQSKKCNYFWKIKIVCIFELVKVTLSN